MVLTAVHKQCAWSIQPPTIGIEPNTGTPFRHDASCWIHALLVMPVNVHLTVTLYLASGLVLQRCECRLPDVSHAQGRRIAPTDLDPRRLGGQPTADCGSP